MKRLFGKKALLEVIDSTDIISVELTSNNNELIEILNRKGIRYSIKNKNFFNQHFPKEFNHQGVVINLKDGKQNSSIEELLHEQKDKSVVVIVDSINDPQNFGAIIRTCAAFNVDAVIYKERNQVQITDFVAKSSMGGIAKVNMIKVSNLSNAIELLKKSGYWIYVSALTDKAQNYAHIKYDKKVVLVVGNEDSGVSKLITEHADFIIKIPMSDNIQSLNVSVATGILLAQIFGQ